jgi:hypothetical protein
MLRQDRTAAVLSWLVNKHGGVNNEQTGQLLTIADFDIYGHDDKPEEREATPEELAAELMGGKRNG